MSTRHLARAALYAALYAALTLAPGLNGLAYGQVQFRVAEGMLAFACLDWAAVPGLTVGTALANIARAHWVALAVPALVNGFGVAAELTLVLRLPYWPSVGFVALGEAAVLATVGAVLFASIRRHAPALGLHPRRRS